MKTPNSMPPKHLELGCLRTTSKTIEDKTGVWGFQTVDGRGYDARILHNLAPMVAPTAATSGPMTARC